MSIKLPQKFSNILKDEYRALVDTAISRYKDIYINNKLDFFQDYTDHGIKHIEEVLETAASIIDDNSFIYLNEKDISVLIISVILHDVGMHISKDGLKKILDPDFDKNRVQALDQLSWKEEWISFFQEAKRFNDEQLKNIFGTSEQNIIEPNIDNLDDYDRKLFGEFLRRFHHRLAHEIALGGFPTKKESENVLIHSGDIDLDIIDLAGIVARSHGMPIRKCIDYLENKYSDAWQAPYDVKAVFLMVILRISDYLQIHSDRASKIILKSKRFESPISKKEWEKHSSIKDINIKTADPERVFVIARPTNSVIYLELESLFKDIQKELDISWAVLGETYGRDNDLKNLKIKFRRLRSILDDKEEFNKTVNYIPEKVFFNADPSLLKLLIGPLYGDDPKYGVRELLQNSIDAIKEKKYLFGDNGKVSITLQAIKKDKPRYEIIITDSGIGMSKDTIINYFFKAGASYRKSMAWKKNFIDDNEVKIQKTGRFGVGVLAVFLLGEEFELWTKYSLPDSQGYYCKASLGMTQVELVKQDCDIGTTIRITLKDSVNAIINSKLRELADFAKEQTNYHSNPPILLEWFTWYVMESPKIEYQIDDKLKKAFRYRKSNLQISSNNDSPSKNWRSFSTKDYISIHWTIDLTEKLYQMYDEEDTTHNHNEILACNGFKINRGYKISDPTFNWRVPKISIFDNNANLPLSLSRDYIQEDSLPFEEELLEQVSLEIIKSLLKTEFSQIGPYYIAKPNIVKFIGEVNLSDFVVVVKDEFTILNSAIFSLLRISNFTQFWARQTVKHSGTAIFTPKSFYQANLISADPINFYRPILEASAHLKNRYIHWFSLGGAYESRREDLFDRSYLGTSKLNYLLQGKRLSKSYKDSLVSETTNKTWAAILSSKSSQHKTNINIKHLDPQIYPLIIERYTNLKDDPNNFFTKAWKKYLGEEWTFPIDQTKRPDIGKKNPPSLVL